MCAQQPTEGSHARKEINTAKSVAKSGIQSVISLHEIFLD
jgi:hypothetical protein